MMSLTKPTRRIVIVDDHTLFREGLRTILEMDCLLYTSDAADD